LRSTFGSLVMGLESLKEPILGTAREMILREGDIPPTVFLVREQEVVGMAPLGTVPVPEQLERHMKTRVGMYFLGGLLRLKPPPVSWDSVAFISTAWMVSPTPEEPVPRPPLSEHPRRTEVLVLTYSRGQDDHDMEVIPFFRSPDGPVFEAPLEKAEKVESVVMDSFWKGYELKPPPVGF